MKKFLLILICLVVILFFVGFNYLLWDRENKQANIQDLQDTNEVKTDTIEILYRQIDNLDNANKALQSDINQLNNKIDSYENVIKAYTSRIEDLSSKILEKEKSISILKQQVDKDMLTNVVLAWVNALGNGDLETAYNLTYRNSNNISYEEFYGDYRGTIVSIGVHSLQEIVNEDETSKGEFLYSVVLDIELSENKKNIENFEYVNGLNSRILVIDYNEEVDGWVIKDIVAGS